MYRIAVLAEQKAERQHYAEQITRFCEVKGLFPQVMQYDDQERFFETAQKDAPTNAVIALSGVAGLNAAEHLRSLCPACRLRFLLHKQLQFRKVPRRKEPEQ